eukprot:g6320.t1
MAEETKGPAAAGGEDEEDAVSSLPQTFEEKLAAATLDPGFAAEPQGYLRKPDFKRAKQSRGGGKSKSGSFLSLASSNAWSRRYFVLDGMSLRYYPSQAMAKESGAVHMATIKSVVPSVIDDAPKGVTLDLNSEDRIYSLASDNEAEMIQWALVLRATLSGDRKPRPSISGPSGAAAAAAADKKAEGGDGGGGGDDDEKAAAAAAADGEKDVVASGDAIPDEEGDGEFRVVAGKNPDDGAKQISGWLWKRGNQRNLGGMGIKIGSDAFKQRFCVVEDGVLRYYLWGEHGDNDEVLMDLYMGEIDLGFVTDVSNHDDDKAPGACFAMKTAGRTYIMSSESEQSRDTWVELIGEIVASNRTRAPTEAGEEEAALAKAAGERRQKIEAALAFKASCKLGQKGIRGLSMSDGKVLCITSQVVRVYAKEEDLFDDDAEPLKTLVFSNIASVSMKGATAHHAFEIACQGSGRRAAKSGNKADSMVVTTIGSDSYEDSVAIMKAICHATKRLTLEKKGSKQWASNDPTVSLDPLMMRNMKMYGGGITPKGGRRTSMQAGSGRGGRGGRGGR